MVVAPSRVAERGSGQVDGKAHRRAGITSGTSAAGSRLRPSYFSCQNLASPLSPARSAGGRQPGLSNIPPAMRTQRWARAVAGRPTAAITSPRTATRIPSF